MEKKRGIPRAVVYILIAVGAFLVGVIIFNTIIMPGLVGRRDVVIIPDLEGLSLAMAEEKCGERGLELSIMAHRNSEEVPEGYIIEQHPGPNDKLKEGRAIRVVVSSGHMMETVPALAAKSLRQAELLLGSARLKKGRIVRIFSNEKGQNTVLATSPAAGTIIPRDSRVDILLEVCGEPRMFLMPDITGMDLPFVKERLEKLGLVVARIVSRRDDDKFPNTILSQTPEAGSLIKEGGEIELVVSTVE
jgi:serine/threonine-protein kinase